VVKGVKGSILMSDDGEIDDLVDKLEKKEIKPKEIIKILDERKLSEKAVFKFGAWIYLIWVVLCFSSALAKYSKWEYISFLNKIPSYRFPDVVIYIAAAFFIGALILTVWSSQYNIRKGGVHSEDYTIILFDSGPYRLLRHPSNLAWSVFSITIPVILSKWLPFTFLSIIGIIVIVSLHYYSSIIEERMLDLRKWGDAYREYMKKVPRWNIIAGLCRLIKKR
jgi:protein-S-isoprenylcysteine O-methyltransferase Ste14